MRFPTFDTILQFLFPVRCYQCGAASTALCSRCSSSIALAQTIEPTIFAVFDYSNPIVRAGIRSLKYRGHSELAKRLADAAILYIVDFLSDQLLTSRKQRIFLVPIPLHTSRSRTRGFNQSKLLAQWWSQALETAELLPCLSKVRSTTPQAGLSKRARLHNIEHSMRSTQTLNAGDLYVIIDDVITTGATTAEAYRALREAGARYVVRVALAHGHTQIQPLGYRDCRVKNYCC